ncbi:MAG: MFS transporter [Clostridiales bacterium]|nr:MFS transporter [Clostridiales bacterium]
MEELGSRKKRITPAVTVIILFGIISLLGDVVYESARSVNGQYLNILGVSAAQVGLIFGIGEFLGYFLRLLAGIFSDKHGKHWIYIFVGYGMLISVPLIGFTQNWNILFILLLMERIGKALRSPAKDTILSGVAENQVGIGFAFGLQEALDQLGAFAGPMIFTAIFFLTQKNGIPQYQLGYKTLFIALVLLMLFITFVHRKIRRDNLIPQVAKRDRKAKKLQRIFWIYTAFTFFATLGFVNFSFIGYHLKAQELLPDGTITLLYAIAMGVDAVVALIVGLAYDRLKKKTGKKTGGLLVLTAVPFLTLVMPFLVLFQNKALIIAGIVVFGVVMSVHETIMRSAIADITPFHKRGTGYGVFNTAYGLALFVGAAFMGWLYDLQQSGIIMGFVVAVEIVAIVLFFIMRHKLLRKELS